MWFTHLKGMELSNDNAHDVAEYCGGYVLHDSHGEAGVVVETHRGDMLVTQGDLVGKDQTGRLSVIRFTEDNPKKGSKVTPLDVKRKK